MYAIVEIAGKQFKVREQERVYVPLLQAAVQDNLTLDRVLLVADDGDVHVGSPLVANASVTALVLDHVKGDKVLVFKKRKRKRYRVRRGHRQQYTQLLIESVSLGKKARSRKKEAAEEPAEEPAEA